MSDNFCKASYVKLENYSGPLDLLLQLIRKQEMDIFRIDIHAITKQYVRYLQKIPKPDLENAGDFIRIASWLVYIKSKSLIPDEKTEEESPSSNLKNKLTRLLASYQKFQKAGEILYKRILLGRDCWKSPHSFSLSAPKENKINIDKEKGLFQLSQAYHQSLEARKARQNYKIAQPVPSFLRHLRQIAEIFTMGARLKFNQLVCIHKGKYSRLLSFLSILELSKLGFVQLLQKQLFSGIEIFVKRQITEESIKKNFSENEEIP